METWSIITPPGAVAVRRQVLPMVEAHRRSHRSIDSQWSFPQTPNTVGVDLLRSWHNPHIGSLTWGIRAFSGKNQLQFPETAPIHLAKIAIGTIERWQNGNTRLGLTSNISHLLVFDGDLIRPAEEKRKKERKKVPGGHGNSVQYSCPGNPTDRGAWRAGLYGVTEELDTT